MPTLKEVLEGKKETTTKAVSIPKAPKRPITKIVEKIVEKEVIIEKEVPLWAQDAWDDLEPSIASAFKQSKWPSKYKSLVIFKRWYDKLPKEE